MAEQFDDYTADRFYGPFPVLSTTGVTGTNGKTTVSYLLAQCLTLLGSPCGLVGTFGTGFIDQLDFNGFTTPDILNMHRFYSELKASDARAVAMEVSSHGLAQGRVARVPFESALFTNLTQDHLDYHGDMAAYGNAKLQLFGYKTLQRAVLNFDDPFTRTILRSLPTHLPVVLCAKHTPAVIAYAQHASRLSTVTVVEADLSPKGIVAKLNTPFGQGQLRSRLLGEFNVSNLLLVVAELFMRNYSLEDVLYVIADA